MTARPRLLAFVCGGTMLLRSALARAEDTPGEKLFRDGRAFMLAGRFAEACPLLAESQRLEPHVGTLLNLAACHESEQKVASAWVEYTKALTAARAEGQAERATLAEKRIAALEPRVPWLRVDGGSAAVTLDGSALAPEAVGKELPVDPGSHVVRAERAGRAAFEENVAIREGEHRAVVVRFAESTEPAPDTIVVEPKALPPAETAPVKKSRWILEPGIFVGYVFGTVEGSKAKALYPSSVVLESSTGALTSCASTTCYFDTIREGDGLTAGINVFAGYAVTDSVDLGARLIAGPEIGPAGASVVALGPSVTLHATDAVSIGAWALLGNATLKGRAPLQSVSSDLRPTSSGFVAVEGSLGGGPGVGLELSVRLLKLGRGVISASTTPFLIAGDGAAFCIPLTVGYRFQ